MQQIVINGKVITKRNFNSLFKIHEILVNLSDYYENRDVSLNYGNGSVYH